MSDAFEKRIQLVHAACNRGFETGRDHCRFMRSGDCSLTGDRRGVPSACGTIVRTVDALIKVGAIDETWGQASPGDR